jgi:flagellar biosynthesis/type III secretory pathway chaperone
MMKNNSVMLPSAGSTRFIPDDSLINLQFLLDEMTRLLQQFVKSLQQEKTLIIDGSPEELMRCVEEKDAVLHQVSLLEKKSQFMVQQISLAAGKKETLTLRQLIPMIQGSFKTRFERSLSGIEALSASITELNQINGLLVEKTLKRVSDLVQLIHYLSGNTATYTASGAMEEHSLPGRILIKG